jgi:type VI protein secretion system component Hcp
MAGDIPDVYLKFDGFTGECNDSKHPGDEGWITVQSFSFGFGFQGSDGASSDNQGDSSSASPTGAPGQQNPNAPAQTPKAKRKQKSPAMQSGPMTFDSISFTKGSDVMSSSLMDACHKGHQIDTVELQACRYGGGPNNDKIPFLHLVFKNVTLKTCNLNLATEGLPSEDITFDYKKVEMKCMWTDNATGKPLEEQPITAGWDLQAQQTLDDLPVDDGDGGDDGDDDN